MAAAERQRHRVAGGRRQAGGAARVPARYSYSYMLRCVAAAGACRRALHEITCWLVCSPPLPGTAWPLPTSGCPRWRSGPPGWRPTTWWRWGRGPASARSPSASFQFAWPAAMFDLEHRRRQTMHPITYKLGKKGAYTPLVFPAAQQFRGLPLVRTFVTHCRWRHQCIG